MAEVDLELCHYSRFLQASVGEFARNTPPRSTSELRAQRRNWCAFGRLSISSSVKQCDLIRAYERAGSVALKDIAESATVGKRGRLLAERSEPKGEAVEHR